MPCSVCNREFFCVYGLETHLAGHGDVPRSKLAFRCPVCRSPSITASKLDQHLRTAHASGKDSLDSEKICDGRAPCVALHDEKGSCEKEKEKKSGAGKTSGGAVASSVTSSAFHDLYFVDFSCDKFTLTAKAFCEKNHQRKTNGRASHPNICRSCECSFPSIGALDLHAAGHSPPKRTVCESCERMFATRSQYDDHILVHHESEKIITGVSKLAGVDDNDIQDCIAEEEFLLVMGLKVSEVGLRRTCEPMASMVKTPVASVVKMPVSVGMNDIGEKSVVKSLSFDANQNLVEKGVKVTITPTNDRFGGSQVMIRGDNVLQSVLLTSLQAASSSAAQPLRSLPMLQRMPISIGQAFTFSLPPADGTVGTPRPILPSLKPAPGVAPSHFIFPRIITLPITAEPTTVGELMACGKVVTISGATRDIGRILPLTDASVIERSPPEEDTASDGLILRPSPKMDLPEKDDHDGSPYSCQFCEEIFFNYRAYRGEQINIYLIQI